MTRNAQFIEQADSEEYLHKSAWQVVLRQIGHAEANPIGSLYDDLVAMVFAYHALEGYLNFIGDMIAPDLWSDEKSTFKETGLDGKLAVICERCSIDVPKKGARPRSTVSELKKLRENMAHPKTFKAKTMIRFVEGKPPPPFAPSYISTLVSHAKALRARDDIKRIADDIHKAALMNHSRAELTSHAFEGIHSQRTTSTG